MEAPTGPTDATDARTVGAPGRVHRALNVVFQRSILRRTIPIALVVGTVLSLVNQLHVIVRDHADVATWLRVAANYVIPFIVSSLGVLAATRAESE